MFYSAVERTSRLFLAAIPALVLISVACFGNGNDADPTALPEASTIREATSTPQPTIAPTSAPLGTTCEADFPPSFSRTKNPSGGDIGFRREPFCIAWTDTFQNETGFRVVLRYNGGEQFEYRVGANVNEVFPPQSDWPDTLPQRADDLDAPENAGALAGFRRKDIKFTVFAITADGEMVVDGFALTIQ